MKNNRKGNWKGWLERQFEDPIFCIYYGLERIETEMNDIRRAVRKLEKAHKQKNINNA